MIQIADKHNCCGCSACANVCPKTCIAMSTDEEGFLYPVVDMSVCVGCGLCEKVCPFLTELRPKKPKNTYAAINPNEEERLRSSSGGIFTLLAQETLKAGGVVFGAAFDGDWSVKHIGIENIKELPKLQGSKYVQSKIGNSYKKAKQLLDKDIPVLFSGTTCQIAGLLKYLRKEYEKLLTVDVICHGVPSPRIWQDVVS